MRTLFAGLTLFAMVVLAAAETNPEVRRGTEKDVQVDRLPEAIPWEQAAGDQFIWDKFSKRPEIRLFLHYTTENWRKNYDRFAEALVTKAKERGFESDSLKLSLRKILDEPSFQKPREIGYLPIGAYRTTMGSIQVWVIFCLWEYADDPSKAKTDFLPPMQDDSKQSTAPPVSRAPPAPPEWPTVGHIRMFTYDLSTAQLVGFVTCD